MGWPSGWTLGLKVLVPGLTGHVSQLSPSICTLKNLLGQQFTPLRLTRHKQWLISDWKFWRYTVGEKKENYHSTPLQSMLKLKKKKNSNNIANSQTHRPPGDAVKLSTLKLLTLSTWWPLHLPPKFPNPQTAREETHHF